jgi:hypothetical protein
MALAAVLLLALQVTRVEVVAWEVYYRGAADTKGEMWAFKLLNGKYVLVDIDRIREAP